MVGQAHKSVQLCNELPLWHLFDQDSDLCAEYMQVQDIEAGELACHSAVSCLHARLEVSKTI